MKHLRQKAAARLTAGALALSLTAGAFLSVPLVSEAACRHQWVKTAETGGSCTSLGTIEYRCYACGVSKTKPSSELGHSWTVEEQKDASCTEAGYARKTCEKCGARTTEYLEPLGHNWTELSRTEATCSARGSVTRQCLTCGETKTAGTPKKWHTYERRTADPSCTAAGESSDVCTGCGTKRHVKAISPLGHLYNSSGVCIRCGNDISYKEPEPEKPSDPCAGGHTQTTSILRAATCSASGTKQVSCKVCGKVLQTAAIPVIPHTQQMVIAKNSTCTVAGVKQAKCRVCGKVLKSEPLSKLTHTYKNHKCTQCGINEKLNGPEALIATCDWYVKRLDAAVSKKEKWVYSNKNSIVKQNGTFDDMLNKKGGAKYRGGNCASPANWVLKDLGVIAKNHGFYGSGSSNKYGLGIKGYNRGSTSVKKEFDAAGKVINMKGKKFKDLVKAGKIKPGDICFTHTSYNHTFIYRGGKTFFASGHDSKWHKDSKVKTDDGNKAVFDKWTNSFSSCSNYNVKISYVYRLDSKYYPKYYRDVNGKLVKNGGK